VVGIHLINEYGTLFPTVTREIRLRITIDIQFAHHPPPLDGRFPDRGSHSLPFPYHVAWDTDIH
jgi:hypothetical protein